MSDNISKIGDLLREAAEAHHVVYRITDGTDDDWASWYSDWLARLSELPGLLGRRPARSELTFHLVALDREYSLADPPSPQPWARFYAERLNEAFS